MKKNLTSPIAITMGEPSGIGPEIIIKTWLKKLDPKYKFFVIGNYNFFLKWKKILNLDIPIKKIIEPDETDNLFSEFLPIIDIPFSEDFTIGKPSKANKDSILNSIKYGVNYIKNKKCSSIITCPVQKNIFYGNSFNFPGMTEFLGSLVTEKCTPTMMLHSSELKIVLMTTHIPLREINSTLNTKDIYNKIRIAISYLSNYFCIKKPNIAVTGLNPHLGEMIEENSEENNIIVPAIKQLISEGYNVKGPIASDSLFYKENRKKFDLVVCMYHDQGLIPIKTIDFWNTVNITLGLPFLRISPDHGTALDIAGRGIGNPSSLLQSIKITKQILENKNSIHV